MSCLLHLDPNSGGSDSKQQPPQSLSWNLLCYHRGRVDVAVCSGSRVKTFIFVFNFRGYQVSDLIQMKQIEPCYQNTSFPTGWNIYYEAVFFLGFTKMHVHVVMTNSVIATQDFLLTATSKLDERKCFVLKQIYECLIINCASLYPREAHIWHIPGSESGQSQKQCHKTRSETKATNARRTTALCSALCHYLIK